MLKREIWFGVTGVFRSSAVSRRAKPLSRAAMGRRSAPGPSASPPSGATLIFVEISPSQIYDCNLS